MITLPPRLGALYRRLSVPLRTLPDFLIVGAMKAGTSSAFWYLRQHPRIIGSVIKEIGFFDVHFGRGVTWYRTHFPRRRRGIITGEATVNYMFVPIARRRLAQTVPGARLIALLRNPVDRAHSHYHHHVRHVGEPRSFDGVLDALESGDQRERETLWPGSLLARGLYAEQIAGLLELFPREQVLIVRSEDLFERPAAVVARMDRFLGLPPWPVDVGSRRNAGDYHPMTPATRARLIEYYRPHNACLEDLLGRELAWDS